VGLPETDRYVLGPPIAAGGMGRVHLGRVCGAEGFSRVVAIKCLRQEFATDSEHVAMFIDEARLASRIRHANVVPTIDACRAGRDLWLVMDYVAGESLARLLLKGPLRPDVALAIFHDALAGLESAHLATDATGAPLGLVHRDVSPQNILVGIDGVARIADFGVAKARNRISSTRDGEFKGKIGYAAPEVIQGAPATERSDIYGVGVTLWEALVGKRLFVGENESAVLYKVLEWTPPKVSEAAPALGTAYDELVARALARDPNQRFASAREMLDALDACGPRASPREVARVLEERLGDALRERAALVREFETGSSSIVRPRSPFPPIEEHAPTETIREVRSDLVSLPAVVHAQPQTPLATVRLPGGPSALPSAQPRRRVAVIAGIAAIAAAAFVAIVVVAGVRLRATSQAQSATVSSEPPPEVIAAAEPSEPPLPPPSPAPSPSIEEASPAPSPTPETPVPDASRAVAKPTPKAASKATKAKTTPSPKPKVSCDPPYTIDEAGDRHYKRECL